MNKGQLLCSGWQTSLPILAGDNGNLTDGGDTVSSPPRISDDGGFLVALSATGPHTTPLHLAVVIAGTPIAPGCLQDNWYAGGSYSSSEDNNDDSPPLLDLPEVLETAMAAASETITVAASAPKDLAAVLAAVSELEHRRNCDFDANMAALRGCNLHVETNLSYFCEDIALIRGDMRHLTDESTALVELNKATCLVVESNASTFLQAMDASAFLQAMEANMASFWR